MYALSGFHRVVVIAKSTFFLLRTPAIILTKSMVISSVGYVKLFWKGCMFSDQVF